MERMMFEFGDFELDELSFELRRLGARVKVQPKVLKLIFHLVRNRERVVCSEELFRVLWPGQSVGETSLTRTVRGARMALDDSGASQSTLRTVRGHGYRFAKIVREHPEATDDAFDGRIEETLHGVSDRTRAALQVAAVVGHAFSVTVLSAGNGAPAARIASALEEATGAGLIRPAAGIPNLYIFACGAVRDALCRELPLASQRDLQQRISTALVDGSGRGPRVPAGTALRSTRSA